MKSITELLILIIFVINITKATKGTETTIVGITPYVTSDKMIILLWSGDRYVHPIYKVFYANFKVRWMVSNAIEDKPNVYYCVYVHLKKGGEFLTTPFEKEPNYRFPVCDEDPHLPKIVGIRLSEKAFLAQDFRQYNVSHPDTDLGLYGRLYVHIPGPGSRIIYSASLEKA